MSNPIRKAKVLADISYAIQIYYFRSYLPLASRKASLLAQAQLLIPTAYNSYMYRFFSLHWRKIAILCLLHCQYHVLAQLSLQSLYLMMVMKQMLMLAKNQFKKLYQFSP